MSESIKRQALWLRILEMYDAGMPPELISDILKEEGHDFSPEEILIIISVYPKMGRGKPIARKK